MQPPFNKRAEQAVLAVLLLRPELADDVSARLPEPECFHAREHQALYQALLNVARRRELPDEVVVGAEVQRLGLLREFRGGLGQCESILREIAESLPRQREQGMSAVAQYESYVGVVAGHWVARRLQRQLAEIGDLAGVPGTAVSDLLQLLHHAGASTLALTDYAPTRRIGEVAEKVVEDVVEFVEQARDAGKGLLAGLPSGLPGVDVIMGGYRPKRLHLIGAATSQGKTSVMMQSVMAIAEHIRARGVDAGGVYVASLEEDDDELAWRPVVGGAGVDSRRAREGAITDAQLEAIAARAQAIGNSRVFIDRLRRPTWPQLRARCILAYEKFGIEAIFVDYLQIVAKPPRMEKKDHIAELAQQAKDLANDLRLPFIAMAQLTRGAGKSRKAPVVQDFGESKGMEDSTDVALLLHNRGRATPSLEDEVAAREGAELPARDNMDFIIAKNRGGKTGVARAVFNKTLQSFEPPPPPEDRNWFGPRNENEGKETND